MSNPYDQQANTPPYMHSNGRIHSAHDVPSHPRPQQSHVQQQYAHPAHPQLHSFPGRALPSQAMHEQFSSLVFQQPPMHLLSSAPHSRAIPSSSQQFHTVQTGQQPGGIMNTNSFASLVQNQSIPALPANKNHIQLPYFSEASRSGGTLVGGQQRAPTEYNKISQAPPPATMATVPHMPMVIQLEQQDVVQSALHTRGMNPPLSSDQTTSQTTRPPQPTADGIHFVAGAQAPHVEKQTAIPLTPVEQFASKHVSNILERATPFLNIFLEAQHNLVRNELLRLNSKYIHDVSTLQDELRRARQAEQEARGEKEKIVQVCENIVTQALRWKESLQDTTGKFTELQRQHWRLAQLALQQNKLLSANSSGSENVATINRVLKNSKTYEDIKSRNEADASTSANGSSVNFVSMDNDPIKVGDEKDRLRLQNEINIVSEILERKPKVESPAHGSASTENHKPETSSTGIKDMAPYIIDLTIDPPRQNGVLASPPARALDPPKDPPLTVQTPMDVTTAGCDDSKDGSVAALLEDIGGDPTSIGDGLKRSQETDDTDDRVRKRQRPEDPPAMNSDSNAKSQPDLVSSEITMGPATTEAQKDREDVESDRIADEANLPGPPAKNSCSNDLQSKNFDALHLLLVYHKNETGTNECRFCLIDQHQQRSDKTMVFPASVTNEDLVEHALSCHREYMAHVLQMTKAELLAAYSKIC